MSDFHQSGPVTALPRLVPRPIEDLEAHILKLTPKFPVSLVLPMVPSELDRPALARILDELISVP
jgi:glucosyl-3-phosphoglycerate synthase